MDDLSAILEDILEATSPDALWQILLGYCHNQGATMVSYHAVDATGAATEIATDGFPEDWVRTYVSENLLKIDPIPHLAARMAEPFRWSDVSTLLTLTPENERYVAALEAANLGDGLAFEVFGPGLQNAYVGVGFGVPKLALSRTDIFGLQCVAQACHTRYCALLTSLPPHDPLSPREKDVLTWVARGKSNSVIAQILDLSPHTVDSYMRGIYKKLGTSDRTSAALRGVGHGLIQLSSD